MSSAALEQAAFGDRPDRVVDFHPTEPRDRWLAAVVLGGQGRYAAAATLLAGLMRDRDPELAALAAATLAAHRRQLGGHAAARVLDAAGLSRLAAAGRYPLAASAEYPAAATTGHASPAAAGRGLRAERLGASVGHESPAAAGRALPGAPSAGAERPAASGRTVRAERLGASAGHDSPAAAERALRAGLSASAEPAGASADHVSPDAADRALRPGPFAGGERSAATHDSPAAAGRALRAGLSASAEPAGANADHVWPAAADRALRAERLGVSAGHDSPAPAGQARSAAPSASAERPVASSGHVSPAATDSPQTRSLAAEAASDVLLGLAADAVGAGRLVEARRLHARAASLPGWRGAIRAGWVSAEIELRAGRAAAAVPPAHEAAELATASGSVRHRIKSDLVLGAALGAGSVARKLVTRARDDAVDLDLLSLVWPAALILAELDPTDTAAHCRCAAVALHGVLHRADPRGRELAERSPWVPSVTGPTG